jgi:predicted nucleotidyltransferase
VDVPVPQTVAWLRAQERARQAQTDARSALLRAWLPTAVRILREQHGACRIWLFCSLVEGGTSPSSDVDLAVEGVGQERYFDALADLMRALPFDVDLVRLEDAPTPLRERIRSEGEPL